MTDLYEKYKISRNATWQILIDFNVSEIPIKIIDICKQLNVQVLSTDDIVQCKTYISSDESIIYVPSNISDKNQLRYDIAIQLATIVLGLNFDITNPHSDNQAHIFARDLLSPACVLWKLGCIEPNNIVELCKIPLNVAIKRSERMKELIKRNKFLTHPLEQQVFKQFQNFIAQVRNK